MLKNMDVTMEKIKAGESDRSRFDPSCFEVLQTVVGATDAQIVVSSAQWGIRTTGSEATGFLHVVHHFPFSYWGAGLRGAGTRTC